MSVRSGPSCVSRSISYSPCSHLAFGNRSIISSSDRKTCRPRSATCCKRPTTPMRAMQTSSSRTIVSKERMTEEESRRSDYNTSLLDAAKSLTLCFVLFCLTCPVRCSFALPTRSECLDRERNHSSCKTLVYVSLVRCHVTPRPSQARQSNNKATKQNSSLFLLLYTWMYSVMMRSV